MNVNFKSSVGQGKSLFFGKSNDGKKTLFKKKPPVVSPVPTENLLVRFNADSGITQSNGFITSWTDQQNGVVANAFNGPTLLSNELNGRNAVSFDGVNDYLTFTLQSTLLSNQNRTIIIIGKYTNPTTRTQNGMLNSLSPSADRAYIFHSSNTSNAYYYANGLQYGPQPFTPNAYMIQCIVHRAGFGGTFLRINGNQLNSNIGPATDIDSFIIGGRTTDSERFLGTIVEILIYNRELTFQEILKVEAYANV